jgi:ATP-dependent Lhr-like helicase
MSDELSKFLISALGFEASNEFPGLERAEKAFLGNYFLQRRPIQEKSIRDIYKGNDVLMISATASGKTEAALIPIAAKLIANPNQIALYIAPTRALINDIFKRISAPMHELGLDIRIRHGDIALPTNTTLIRVLLTTPESLDILLSKNHRILNRVNYVILDEIHQLYGNTRGDQLLFLLQRLEKNNGLLFQKIALSATIGDPEEVSKWLCPSRDPAHIIFTEERKDIIGEFHWVSDITELRDIIGNSKCKKILCFENSRRGCDDAFLILKDIDPYQSYIHYSTLTKEQREFVERGFKTSQMAICVATSTLELGIDIGSIEKVIMIGIPYSLNSFLQRIGRGGRREEKTEVTFLPKNSIDLLRCFALLRLGEKGCIESAIPGKPYSVFIQQIFSILAGKKKLLIHSEEIVELFGNLTWLAKDKIFEILGKLVDEYLLHRESMNLYGVGSKLEELIEDNAIYTNIIGSESGISIFHDGRLLTKLPLRTNQIKHGNVVLYSGRYWQIVSISDESLGVRSVKPVSDPIRPSWGSRGLFKTSLMLAQGIRDTLINKPSFEGHFVDERCKTILNSLYEKASQIQNTDENVWLEKIDGNYIYYTFAGTLVNKILELFFNKNDHLCQAMPNADGIALLSSNRLNFELLPKNRDEIISFVNSQWQLLSRQTDVGPFFNYLPSVLKKEEILSRVINPSSIDNISQFSDASVLNVNLNIF